MQEQQQQHIKTMLNTNGHLAYYGLHLPPQQPVRIISAEGGYSLAKDPSNSDYTVPVETVMHPSLQPCHQPSSTMSQFLNYLNVSSTGKSTMSTSVSIAPVASTSAKSNTSNSIKSSNDALNNNNNAPNNFVRYGITRDKNNNYLNESRKEHISTNTTVENVTSSTCKSSSVDENEIGFHYQKSSALPSRMVTRSQTAAERMHPTSADENCNDDYPRSRKHTRSPGSDLEDDYSPRKIKREMTPCVVLDDLSYTKNPAGAGIEFGAVCADCGAVAVTGIGWNAHQQAHRNENAACIFCSQVFLTDHGKQIHQQLHRDGQTREVDDFCECGICGGSFISILYLELHLLELHGRDSLSNHTAVHLGPTSSPDPSCPSEYESSQQLFRCGVCRTLFTYSLNLDCHMALHSEVSYCCAICDAAYPTLDPLVEHSKGHRRAALSSAPTMVPLSSQLPTRSPQCSVMQSATNSAYNAWKGQPIRNTFHPRPVPQYSGANTMGGVVNPSCGNSQANNHRTPKVAQPSVMSRSTQVPPPVATVMNTTVPQPVTPTVIPSMAPVMSSPLVPAVNQMMEPQMTPVMTAPMTPAMLNYYMMMSLWGNKNCNQSGIPLWQNYLNPAMANVFSYFNPYLLNNNMMNNPSSSNENDTTTSSQNSCCNQDAEKDSDTQSNGVIGDAEECSVKESVN